MCTAENDGAQYHYLGCQEKFIPRDAKLILNSLPVLRCLCQLKNKGFALFHATCLGGTGHPFRTKHKMPLCACPQVKANYEIAGMVGNGTGNEAETYVIL